MTRETLELDSSESADAGPGPKLGDRPTEVPPAEGTTRAEPEPRRRDWRQVLARGGSLPDDAPAHIGRYRVLHKLGQGGMGTVVAAYDETLERRVALKLLHEDLGAQRRQRVRLLREAQAMARLSHPHVVTVYEADVDEDQLFIAMELVDGSTLDRWQRSEQRSWRECLGVYVQAGRGLEAAHAEQLIHRDFKPGNCIIDTTGRVRVLDFGLARDSTTGPPPAETIAVSELSVLSSNVTRTGAMLGTVAYMSPEQLRGQPADARSDQFSFCVSLHEALYGHRPFSGETAGELFGAMASGNTTHFGRGPARVPASVRRVLRRGLRLAPAERYPSMTELLEDLERIPRRRRWLVVAAGISLSSTIGAGLTWAALPSPSPCAALDGRLPDGWDQTTRASVEQAILGTGLTDAPTVWRGLSSQLDAYASEWSAVRLETCESAEVESRTAPLVYAAQRSCLDDRARTLAVLTGRLAEGDRMVAARAVTAAEALPPASECQDDPAQVGDQPLLAPTSLREERDSVLERTARMFVLERLGRFDEALALADGTVADARAFADRYEPPLLEALLIHGRLLRRSRRFEPATEVLTEALPLAERTSDDRRAIDVDLELAMLSLEQGRDTATEAWLTQAGAKLARLGAEPRRHRLRLHTESRLARSVGDLDRAADLLRQARERCHGEPNEDA
ncbi:MAG: serine/threonine protein kinase, partial [Myxococcales bacterium]|nr:serine/threonine protein kinase [Myxococcales bacterium]